MKLLWPMYPLSFHVHARTQYTWYVSLFPLSSMCTWTLYFISNSLSFLVQIYFIWSCIDQTIRSPNNAHVCMYFLLLSLSLLACIFTTSATWSHVHTPSKLRQATRYIWSRAGFLYFSSRMCKPAHNPNCPYPHVKRSWMSCFPKYIKQYFF